MLSASAEVGIDHPHSWPLEAGDAIFEKARALPFHAALLSACARIVATDGGLAAVSSAETAYVIRGNAINVATASGQFPFWVGVNGRRLFFIANVNADPKAAEDAFQFCFGGAQSVGWKISYQPIEAGTSIWGTCMTADGVVTRIVDKPCSLSEEGLFWATDIAMMVQSWVRTCERAGIGSHPTMAPAPL